METKQKYERALRVSAQPGRNPGVPLDLDWVRAVRVNRSAVERRAATIPTRRTVKKEWQAAWLLRAVTCVDLTTLQGDDTPSNVLRLCAKAQHPVRQDLVEALGATELGIVGGAVCVYHRYVATALAARASRAGMMAGAAFIKTSTGKEAVNATLPVGVVMTRQIREYLEETGHAVGFKPAGGIRSAKGALEWLILMKEELGDEWLRPARFRLGASALLTDIERQLEHFVTGRYSAAHRHPMV